jgi:hypothetical protein
MSTPYGVMRERITQVLRDAAGLPPYRSLRREHLTDAILSRFLFLLSQVVASPADRRKRMFFTGLDIVKRLRWGFALPNVDARPWEFPLFYRQKQVSV